MNKLLLGTVSVIAMGFASQAMAAGSSSAYVSQTGAGQTATINQDTGTDNQVGYSAAFPLLQQNNDSNDPNQTSGTGGNTITITQTSSGNFVYGEWLNGVVTGNPMDYYVQSGTGNNADIEQDGTGDTVNLQQTGSNNGPQSGSPWYNQDSGGSITQDNTSNGSTVTLTQYQSTDSLFNIIQGGKDNTVTASQAGTDMLWIRQGTNSADVWYAPLQTSSGDNNTITVSQSVGGVGTSTNYAALAQGGGNSNKIQVGQNGASNNTDLNQSGSNNTFLSNQTSLASNTWTTENFAGAEYGDFGPAPYANNLPISQTGDNNYINNTQNGSSNILLGSQSVGANILNSSQNGDNNTLTFTQSGGGDVIGNTQSGSYNIASLTQSGGSNSITGSQTGTGLLNQATVTQVSTLNTVSYSQNGGGHTLTVHQ